MDDLAPLRNRLHEIAGKVAEWAGIPIPLAEQSLVLDPSYPFAEFLQDKKADEEQPEGLKFRNKFWSKRYRCFIGMFDYEGKVCALPLSRANHLDQLMSTLHACGVWGIEQESNAVQTLGQLIRHHQFRDYMLSGTFVERSPRSQLVYLFRRLRPTIVMSDKRGGLVAIAALCLHPIGYYEDSWAGAMCPTDDVIAHLMLMRGDEAMFWRRSNQIPPHWSEAGI